MRHFFISFTFIFCTLSTSNAAVYQEEVKYYDVEILLFENLKQNPNNTETWPTSLEYTPPENSVFIGSPFPGPIPTNYNPRFTFKPIKATTYQLQEEAKALTEHENYRILYHRSWRQPGMKRDEAVSVKIERDIPRIPIPQLNDGSLDTTQLEYNQIIEQRLPKINNLQGLVTISLSRYLHIKTDIHYTQHVALKSTNSSFSEELDPTFVEIRPQVYQLKQTRKMRSKELHYLDNPKLGLLVYITPVNTK